MRDVDDALASAFADVFGVEMIEAETLTSPRRDCRPRPPLPEVERGSLVEVAVGR
jgi:hypothetical protein